MASIGGDLIMNTRGDIQCPIGATSGTLSVAAGVGAVYDIPAWAEGVLLQIPSTAPSAVYLRGGASTLAAASVDVAGTGTDAVFVPGTIIRLSVQGVARLAMMTASGTSIVYVVPYVRG